MFGLQTGVLRLADIEKKKSSLQDFRLLNRIQT